MSRVVGRLGGVRHLHHRDRPAGAVVQHERLVALAAQVGGRRGLHGEGRRGDLDGLVDGPLRWPDGQHRVDGR